VGGGGGMHSEAASITVRGDPKIAESTSSIGELESKPEESELVVDEVAEGVSVCAVLVMVVEEEVEGTVAFRFDAFFRDRRFDEVSDFFFLRHLWPGAGMTGVPSSLYSLVQKPFLSSCERNKAGWVVSTAETVCFHVPVRGLGSHNSPQFSSMYSQISVL